jgi:DNA-binding response OmpR family regulator
VGKPPIILIVEDDADLRRVWRLALQLEGFDIEEAGDGIMALRRLDNHPPDLVVLDLGLPALGGLSVQQEIAAHALTRAIPIVIVTGSVEDLSHVDVSCVLRKPVGPEQVVATVRRCLRSGASSIVPSLTKRHGIHRTTRNGRRAR